MFSTKRIGALAAIATVAIAPTAGAIPGPTPVPPELPVSVCELVPPTANLIVGDNNANVLVGTPGNDVIDARGGNDRIDGLGGDDLICAGDGDDLVRAGAGNDTVFGALG